MSLPLKAQHLSLKLSILHYQAIDAVIKMPRPVLLNTAIAL